MVRRGKAFVISSKANTERNHNMYSEKTLRRKAEKLGYRIKKGFKIFGNGSIANRTPGYSVIDTEYNCYVGGYNCVFYNIWSLEDVEKFLKDEYLANGLVF